MSQGFRCLLVVKELLPGEYRRGMREGAKAKRGVWGGDPTGSSGA